MRRNTRRSARRCRSAGGAALRRRSPSRASSRRSTSASHRRSGARHSGCRHSGRGSTRPRPARRCNRPAARTSCAAAKRRRSSAPAAFSHAMPCCQSFSISSGMPSTRYSFGTPIFMPLIDLPTDFVHSRHGQVQAGGILRVARAHRPRASSPRPSPSWRAARPDRATRRTRPCHSGWRGRRSA